MTRILPACLALLAVTALAFASGSALTRAAIVGATDLPTMPRAKDMVTLRPGPAYTVPTGYRLVLQSVNCGNSSNGVELAFIYLNGASSSGYDLVLSVGRGGVADFPSSYALPAGTMILVDQTSGQIPASWSPLFTLTGYLELDH